MLVLGCLLGCGGWLLKNSVEAHNPFYPLLGSWVGGKTLNPEKVAQWNRAHQVPRVGSPSEDSPDYGIRSLIGAMVEMGLTSRFLCLMLAPLAILGMVVYYRRTWLVLYPMIWIFVVWWGMTHRLDRFWLPLLPFAALAAGMGAHWLIQQWRGVPLFALAGISLLHSLLMISRWPFNDNRIGVQLKASVMMTSSLRKRTTQRRGNR